MKNLLYALMFVSCYSIADDHRLYDHYGYGSRYNQQQVYPDNVQLYIMQRQAERIQKENHDYAVRQGLKDAWRGGGGGCISCDVPVRSGY